MKWIKRIFYSILIILLLFVTILGIQGFIMYQNAAKDNNIAIQIEKIREDENYISLDLVPTMYKDAVVAVEDRRFYKHGAIDIISIGRAIITNIKKFDLVEGGSTITQQIAKNIFFTQEESAIRKIAEIFMAFDLESRYEKDDILELYLNTSYFGYGYTGIKEASLGYLGKQPIEMTDYESTLLAGVPNAPSAYSPRSNMELAKKRQQKVISSLVKNNYISQDQANTILEQESKDFK